MLEWKIWAELGIEVAKRGFDAIQNRHAPINSDEFIREFKESQKKVVDTLALTDISSQPDDVLVAHTVELLRALAATVKGNLRRRDAIVNANYMIPVAPTPELQKRAHFCEETWAHTSYTCFLETKHWAQQSPDMPAEFLLPVSTAPEHLLFGAPKAFASGATEIIHNTKSAHRLINKKRSPDIHHAVQRYFRERHTRIRSFVSLPIPCMRPVPGLAPFRSENLGVVNIHSDQTSVLGVFPGNQRKMELFLSSNLQALAYFVAALHFKSLKALPPGPADPTTLPPAPSS